MSSEVVLCGELEIWPSKAEMARLLKAAGFLVYVGRYSIRLRDCEHFVFQEYGGDSGDPVLEVDASTLEQMLVDAERVSSTLAAADLRHRFELVDEENQMVGYLHHRWPLESS